VPGISPPPDDTISGTPSTVDTISSQPKKRKAAEAIGSSKPAQRSSKRIAASAAAVSAPPTPLTTGSTMDSEDEFMSGLSSEEDGTLQDDSDNEEGSVDGRHLYSVLLLVIICNPSVDHL
jgi:hypothetical protein